MTNPYVPTCVAADDSVRHHSKVTAVTWRFWLLHFTVFQTSFWIGWMAFFIVDVGLAKTLASALNRELSGNNGMNAESPSKSTF
jgi:hypothetical protein